MDNSLPEALHYYNEALNVYVEGAANAFTFTSPTDHEDIKYLVEGGKLAFRWMKTDWYFNIVKVSQTEDTITITAYGTAFEMLNETVLPYKGEPRVIATTGAAWFSGTDVSGVTGRWAISNSNTAAPEDDAFSVSIQTPTADEPYLWYYQTAQGVSGASTVKAVVQTWEAEGHGDNSVSYRYGISSSGVVPPSTWSTEFVAPTSAQPYVWTYAIITWYQNTAKAFETYLDMFDAPGALTLERNDVKDDKRRLYWDNTQTVLERLYSLASEFDAEIEFVPVLNNDYSLKQIVVNVYKKHSSTSQGIGEKRTDIIVRYGKDIEGITKEQDITELYTAIRPTGKDGITLYGYVPEECEVDTYKLWSRATNKLMYYKRRNQEIIYAYDARLKFPSHSTGSGDKYILFHWENNDCTTQEQLFKEALSKLRTISIPKVEYDLKGYFETGIGDTITVVDECFEPPLYIEARVSEQQICFTDPARSETKFSNVKEIQNAISDELIKLQQDMAQYTLNITSTNGTAFKNGTGSTILVANVTVNGKAVKV